MLKKLLALAIITVALFFAYNYFSGDGAAVQVGQDSVLSTGISNPEDVLMSIASAGSGTVTMTKGSTSKYVVGQWKVEYKEKSQACQISFGISYNGALKKLYGSSSQSENFIENTQLAIRAGDATGTFSPNDLSLSEFTPSFSPESGKTYSFYLYGYAPSDAANLSNGEVYMSSACVRPAGGGYEVWDSKNSSGQNEYFDVSGNTAGYGISGGKKITIQ